MLPSQPPSRCLPLCDLYKRQIEFIAMSSAQQRKPRGEEGVMINTLVQALIKPAKTGGACSWQQLSGFDRGASVFLVNDIARVYAVGKCYWSTVAQPVWIDVRSGGPQAILVLLW